jgi:hypothetical protein
MLPCRCQEELLEVGGKSSLDLAMPYLVESSGEDDESWDELTEASEPDEFTSPESSVDSDEDDYYQPCEEEIVAAREYIRTAASLIPSTNVLILTGPYGLPDALRPFIYDGDYGGTGIAGPDCYRCNKEICPEAERCVVDDISYNLLWKDDIREKEECDKGELEVGVLQCVYCFNLFHRFNCSLSMSKSSYIKAKSTRQWACPNCVPEFIPFNFKITKPNTVIFNLLNLFKRLRRALETYDPIETCCHLITDHFTVQMINKDVSILYEKG